MSDNAAQCVLVLGLSALCIAAVHLGHYWTALGMCVLVIAAASKD
jgi:hypothetical protein